jgi:hypothetical protein
MALSQQLSIICQVLAASVGSGLVGHVAEPVFNSARNADHIAFLGIEALAVRLIEVSSLDDTEDFRFAVAMSGRPGARGIYGIDEAELVRARRRGHAHE